MMSHWKSLALMSLLGVARAQNYSAVVVDFDNDVILSPADAWHGQYSEVCLTSDHYTNQPDASASLTFTGNRVLVYGLRNNVSGSFSFAIDDASPRTYALQSKDVQCEMFIEEYLPYGTHNLTLKLVSTNQDPVVSEGLALGANPVLHLTEIIYYTLDTTPSSSLSLSSSSSSSHKAAIVGGVVGGIVLLAIVLAALLYAIKKQKGPFRGGRHAFDPTRPKAVLDITELSPRSPRSGGFEDAIKFQGAYAKMEDEPGNAMVEDADSTRTKIDTLAVPSLASTSAMGGRGSRGESGMRSRSRSPMPRTDRHSPDV